MSSQKTEAPTAKRILEARRKGQVAKSRELATAASLLCGAVFVSGAFPVLAERLSKIGHALWSEPMVEPVAALRLVVETIVPLLLVLVASVALVVALIVFLQFKPGFYLQSVLFRWERVQPLEGLKKLFSLRSLYEVAKSLVLIVTITGLAMSIYDVALPGTLRLGGAALEQGWAWIGAQVMRLMWGTVPIVAFVGVADLMYQRWRLNQDLKMSRDEVKREHKEAEGDPEAKAARSRAYQELVAHAALEAVRSADVLVINPTHLAIALRYDQDDEDAAPEVVARGQDHLAKRMIDAAREAGVPVMRDVPLARALYLLEVGEEIPESLFEAVAEVLQAAWKLREEEGLADSLGEVVLHAVDDEDTEP